MNYWTVWSDLQALKVPSTLHVSVSVARRSWAGDFQKDLVRSAVCIIYKSYIIQGYTCHEIVMPKYKCEHSNRQYSATHTQNKRTRSQAIRYRKGQDTFVHPKRSCDIRRSSSPLCCSKKNKSFAQDYGTIVNMFGNTRKISLSRCRQTPFFFSNHSRIRQTNATQSELQRAHAIGKLFAIHRSRRLTALGSGASAGC